MLSTSVSNYSRVMPLEDDFVAFRHSPFEDDGDSGRFTAVAVDWNAKQATFNVTLLSSHDSAEDKLWADSFSISKIEKRHLELCLVYPELESHLPKLPKEPQGIWGYIQMAYVPAELCKKMEEYFKDAFDICGWKLFSSVFFGEPLYDDDYTISSLELQRQHFVKEIEQLLQEFQRHLVEKRKASSTDKLFEWYNALWDCLDKVTDAEGKLLAFDCEPYEELRDISQRERSESATMFNQQSMTTSTFQDNAQTFNQWEDQYIEAVKKINEFRIAHYKISLPRLQQLFQLLRDDSAKFTNGKRNRAVAIKLFELEKKSFQNEIEMLNCTNQLKLLERDKIRRDALALDEDLTMAQRLNEKEVQVYEKQCEILATSYEIQDKNEKLVRLDLQNMTNEETGEKMERLKRNKSLTSISRKKALLRNKQKTCEDEIKKLTRKEKDEQEHYVSHHAVQMKIEKRREENEEKKSARLEERQKALIRLKEYKKKHPKAKDVKPPRYQAPSVRKQEQKIKNTSSLDTNASSTPPAKAVLRKDKPPKENGCAGNNNASSPPTVCTPPPPPPTGAVCPPPPPPPPPPGLPPPPPALPPPLPSSSAVAIKVQTSKNSPVIQASSLSQKTLDLDALKIARCRLKKQDNSTPTVNNNQKGFPSGNELTRAIQSVKLRKVVSEEKPAELSPDGAEFLKKALERMNKFTNLSFDEDQGDEEEQEW